MIDQAATWRDGSPSDTDDNSARAHRVRPWTGITLGRVLAHEAPPETLVVRPVRIAPPSVAPAWAGDLGPSLLARTRHVAARGITPPEHVGIDPLADLTRLLSPTPGKQPAPIEMSRLSRTEARIRVNRPSWGARRIELPGIDKVESPRVYWTLNGKVARSIRLLDFDRADLFRAYPMRDFARRVDQTNRPTAPWIETMGHLIGAESHLEGAFYLLADFHADVAFIAGQPFTLAWRENGKKKPNSHTPDCVLATAGGRRILVVDVKNPVDRATDEWQTREVVVRGLLDEMGLDYFVWSGMPRRFQKNLEFLTEARVPAASISHWTPAARDIATTPISIRDLAGTLDAQGYPYRFAVTLVRRLLWTRELTTDLMRLITLDSMVLSAS